MAVQTDTIFPFTLRLNALEAKVLGTAPYPKADAQMDGHPKLGESSKTAMRRVQGIYNTLERLGGDNDGLRRFVENYNTYLPLLASPDPSTSATTTGEIGEPGKATTAPDYDLIPDKVKVTMLLEAAADIRGLERDLREVELLKGRGVEGAGELEDLLPLKPELANRTRTSQEHGRTMDEARRQTTELLSKYNDYTNALSDLFLEVHRKLEEMEEAVSRAERKKRRDMAERY